MNLARDTWLSECLGLNAAELLGVDQSAPSCLAFDAGPYRFVHCRTAPDIDLTAGGFHKIGVLTTYRIPLGDVHAIDPRVIMFPTYRAGYHCVKIAARTKDQSRWAHDPQLELQQISRCVSRAAADQAKQPLFAQMMGSLTNPNDEWAGFCGISLTSDIRHPTSAPRIGRIAVSEPRKGYATVLLHAVMTELHWRGCTALEAGTYDWNRGAHALYRKLGGTVVKTETVWHYHAP